MVPARMQIQDTTAMGTAWPMQTRTASATTRTTVRTRRRVTTTTATTSRARRLTSVVFAVDRASPRAIAIATVTSLMH